MHVVDINCDLGEGFGGHRKVVDEKILDYITSANIACGFHAGDPTTIRKTIQLALEKKVEIGAHPSLPDFMGFGRRNMDISPQEAYDMVVYQTGALKALVETQGGRLHHVKPHGALYNMAVQDKALSDALAAAVYDVHSELILFGLSGSELIAAGEKIGLKTAGEVFSDRTYQDDGSLTPRSDEEALIKDYETAVQQVIQMIKENVVTSINYKKVPIKAETICIHGDGEYALSFAKEIHETLTKAGILQKAVYSDI
ncbi:UPF0271 protein [Salinibacillus kushneri]|uniref:5-oxoprolinase subunit A n=1 Tax=Salinibacillus kushneri TaxID=237682 RepID=A0A1I0CN16_9BACI|nr:5-oxoprolinase subunit PxpA [Salinibacillus kushneri]SET21089.1 UPF0271 protein [Salinibacillus kushneri]